MKNLKKLLAASCMMLAAACTAFAQDEVIQLYDGPATGSETWDWDETMYLGMIADVSHPTLTVYRPEHPNGVGMVVCAGGAFCFLCYDREGEYISKKYNEMGITCFALKYRVYHDADKDRLVKNLTEGKMDSLSQYSLPLALQDAAQAIRYVRSHAADYGIDPERIGISGSSAGGTITMGTAMAFTDEQSRPNYAVATYPYLSPTSCVKRPTITRCRSTSPRPATTPSSPWTVAWPSTACGSTRDKRWRCTFIRRATTASWASSSAWSATTGPTTSSSGSRISIPTTSNDAQAARVWTVSFCTKVIDISA